MNRNFGHINRYLNILLSDIYPQPQDEGHTKMAMEVFDKWILPTKLGKSVLDVGCGDTAFMRNPFEGVGMKYTPVSLKSTDPTILTMDFSFLEFDDESFDLVFARHALEHSPMPLLTLMEWYRVATSFLCLILPDPKHYGWVGRNHYAVMNKEQTISLAERAGWRVIWEDESEPTEIRLMFEKVRDIIHA